MVNGDIGGQARGASRVVVLSPHCDDAVLSLGSFLSRARDAGLDIQMVTVFAGDPDDPGPPSEWDRVRTSTDGQGLVRTSGEAVRQRRAEDDDAVVALGFDLSTTVRRLSSCPDAEVALAEDARARLAVEVAAACEGADVVLAPGYPLIHPAHAEVHRLAVDHLSGQALVGLYREFPYSAIPKMILGSRGTFHAALRGAPWRWLRVYETRRSRAAKATAIRRYVGEIDRLYSPSWHAKLARRVLSREMVAFPAEAHPPADLRALLRPASRFDVMSMGPRNPSLRGSDGAAGPSTADHRHEAPAPR